MSKYFEKLFEDSERSRGSCMDCGGSLNLVEQDFRNSTKVMACERCGMLHLYKRTVFSGWKLEKIKRGL